MHGHPYADALEACLIRSARGGRSEKRAVANIPDMRYDASQAVLRRGLPESELTQRTNWDAFKSTLLRPAGRLWNNEDGARDAAATSASAVAAVTGVGALTTRLPRLAAHLRLGSFGRKAPNLSRVVNSPAAAAVQDKVVRGAGNVAEFLVPRASFFGANIPLAVGRGLKRVPMLRPAMARLSSGRAAGALRTVRDTKNTAALVADRALGAQLMWGTTVADGYKNRAAVERATQVAQQFADEQRGRANLLGNPWGK
jgi:hypothetical protein